MKRGNKERKKEIIAYARKLKEAGIVSYVKMSIQIGRSKSFIPNLMLKELGTVTEEDIKNLKSKYPQALSKKERLIYDKSLKFDVLKEQYELLRKENDILRAQINELRSQIF